MCFDVNKITSSLSAYLKHGTKEIASLKNIVAISTGMRLMVITTPPLGASCTSSALSAMKMRKRSLFLMKNEQLKFDPYSRDFLGQHMRES